ncbi:C3a anaphylatoxin chemotactic receptor-like [Carassius auratus]|uniref:C3a anaphylatoxin chemotactic receptor-like n=1 Tax=Carassius auratus TaxID=7957 RepID=A0A6P6MZ73_CARAU|nr:C3a anaphylatoxin chemotactic receptor-like [Carassius auratus]
MDSSNSSKMNQTDYNNNNLDEVFCLECFEMLMNKISLVFFYLTLILGVPGNAFVVYVAGLKMKRTVNTVWFLNLAIADLLCCLTTLFIVNGSALDPSPYASVLCKIIPFIILINMFASVFTLSLISLDRFTQVITPVWAQNHRSLFIARLTCVSAWILPSLLCVPFMLNKTITVNNKTDCDFADDFQLNRSFCIIRFVIGFLVPLICITTCYGFIAHKLGRSHFHSGRAFRIMSAVIVAFFLCWLPYHIVVLLIMYGEKSSSSVAAAVHPLTFSLAYFNSCLNPILYVFLGQDFKSNVKLSLRRVFERVFSEEGTQAS